MASTKRNWLKRGLSAVLAAAMSMSMAFTGVLAAEPAPSANTVEDGVYRVSIDLWQSAQDNPSMGNRSIRGSSSYNTEHAEDDPDYRPLLVVENGEATLIMEVVPMGALYTAGYLLQLNAYKTDFRSDLQPSQVLAEHRMTDGSLAYDDYNTEDSSVTAAKGKAYPHILAVPVKTPDEAETIEQGTVTCVQVFVPVMASISPSSGNQPARLCVDYSSMTKVDDLSGETEYWLYQAMNTKKGDASAEDWEALQNVISDTKAKLSNTLVRLEYDKEAMAPRVIRVVEEMNASERAAQVKALQGAINAVNGLEDPEVDASALQEALQKAASVDQSKWTADSYAKLQEKVEAGEKLLEGNPSEEQVKQAAKDIEDAISALVPVQTGGDEDGWDGVTTSPATVLATTAMVDSPEELAWAAQQINSGEATFKSIILTKDIDLNSKEWTPIGTKEHPFTGRISGGGYTISNLSITSDGDYRGLIGYAQGADMNNDRVSVNHLTLEGVIDVTGNYVGALFGYVEEFRIDNCTIHVKMTVDGNCVGGVAGQMKRGYLDSTTNLGDIVGKKSSGSKTGGLVGYAYNVSITECLNRGDVTGAGQTGGIAGQLNSAKSSLYGNVSRSSNKGDVSGTSDVGGIVGSATLQGTGSNVVLSNLGDVTGQNQVGGIVGAFSGGTYGSLVSIYNVGKVTDTGTGDSGALVGRIYSMLYIMNGYALENSADVLCTNNTAKRCEVEFESDSWFKSEDFITAQGNFGHDWTLDPAANDGYPMIEFEAELIAAEKLEAAKQAAVAELDKYNPDHYAGLSKTAVEQAKKDAVGNIESAETVEAVNQALAQAKETLDAIPNDANYGLNLTALRTALFKALAVVEQGGDLYTEESWNSLTSLVDEANGKLTTGFGSQDAVDTYTANLNQAVEDLAYKPADYAGVKAAVEQAEALNAENYVNFSAVTAAVEAVDWTKNITEQAAVDAMAKAIEDAIAGLEKISEEPALDRYNLEDGVYSLYGEMIKVDRINHSMSNDAINHTIKLTVEDGKYYLTMDFKGLSYLNKFGYLGDLSYYLDGYTFGDYGRPVGETELAEVLSTQKNADGSDVSDEFNQAGGSYAGKLYPDQVKFPLVSTALHDKDGFVALHVFVPVMESISAGTGSQDVLLKLDWSTLEKTTEDDPGFEPEEPVEQSPAVDLTDEATGVKVHADKGVFEEGVQLVVTEITSGTDYDKAAASLKDIGKKFKLYDVKFVDAQGNEVVPNGTVDISYPVAEGYEVNNVAIYRMNEDGSITLVKGSFENGLVEKGSTMTDTQNTENQGGAQTPQTGDNSMTVPAVLMLVASCGTAVLTLTSRKRRVSK